MRHQKHNLHHPSSAPRPSNLRLERWQRRAIYTVCAWLTLTGALWLLAHFFMRPAGEFGESIHPLEPWSMKLHGAGAMLALFFVGGLMNSHIRRAIKTRRNQRTGWLMIVVLLALTISGYGLYYIAGEYDRPVWSELHWILGLILPVLLSVHIVCGRKSAARTSW